MADGNAELQAMIDKLRGLEDIATRVAPEVADELRAQLEATVNAGQTPDGIPWQPTAKGERPLQNAAARMTVKAIGTTILVRVTGPTALHHMGAAAGRIQRQVIPTRDLPAAATTAIKAVLVRKFNELMGVDK